MKTSLKKKKTLQNLINELLRKNIETMESYRLKFFLLSALIVANANAYECKSIENSAGYSCQTVSKTYKFDGTISSMWFECSTTKKRKIIENSLTKIEVMADKKLKMGQSIDYDKDGNVKKQDDNGIHGFVDVAPGTVGEWMWEALSGWEYILDKKITKEECNIVTAIGDIKSRHTDFDVTKIHSYLNDLNKMNHNEADKLNTPKEWENIWVQGITKEYSNSTSMTLEETKKWLEENRPIPK